MNSKYAFPLLLLIFVFIYFSFPSHKTEYYTQNSLPLTGCSSFFLNGREPILPTGNPLFSLCLSHYKVFFSYQDKTGIIAAERLTAQQTEQAKQIRRTAQFDYKDPIIQSYIKTGYDRGHLAPSADMPDQSSQEQTFIWQNIAPERHKLNAGQWEQIERFMRDQAKKYQEVYVLTGIYTQTKKSINNVIVPDFFYKGYYIPATHKSGVFICKNNDQNTCTEQSVSAFKSITHIDLFPEPVH